MSNRAAAGHEKAVEFTHRLRQLKQHGCNLLVVGATTDEVLTAATRRLLGAHASRRYRLLVFTDPNRAEVETRLPSANTGRLPQTTRVVDYPTAARSVSAAAGAFGDPIPETVVEQRDIVALQTAVLDSISSLEAAHGEFGPAELRVSFDSLTPLLERHDREAVETFVRETTARIEELRGMGHFILPVAYDDETVAEIAPLFDAVIECHSGEGGRQRWHFPNEELTTPWLSLDSN